MLLGKSNHTWEYPINSEADKLADTGIRLAEETAMPLSFSMRLPPPEKPQSSFTRGRLEKKVAREDMRTEPQVQKPQPMEGQA